MDSKGKVLDIAWDYFKLLAQQRVTHFNLFIVFMGAISTVFATQISVDLRGNIIALSLAIAQVFLCFIFHKIDIRNKFLIKHTEEIIKTFENEFGEGVPRIFLMEELLTKERRSQDKKKIIFLRQLSTSQLYNMFYAFFIILGFVEGIFAIILMILN